MPSTRGDGALPSGDADERRLIARVLAGERAAGRALYDAHAQRVYRLAFRLTGDAALAEDCTQDTFIRAFDRLATFRGDSALSTWLHRIAVSVTLNAIRKRKRWLEREGELVEAAGVEAAAREAEPDLQERVKRAIDSLPEIYRLVVVLHDVEEYTHAEIARVLDIPEGTSKARLSVARGRLRKTLADFVPGYT